MLKTENKPHKSNNVPAAQNLSCLKATTKFYKYLIIVIIGERQSGTTDTLGFFSLEHEELRAARNRIQNFIKFFLSAVVFLWARLL